MSRARKIINEIKMKDVKPGVKLKIKKDNFRFKGEEVVVISVDDPKTGDVEDILIKIKAKDNKEYEIGVEEVEGLS